VRPVLHTQPTFSVQVPASEHNVPSLMHGAMLLTLTSSQVNSLSRVRNCRLTGSIVKAKM
jgi:hypothetical protein